MNKVILLGLLMPATAFGQIMENFESGIITNWIQSPERHWNSDNTNSISGALSLHHTFDNPDSGNDRIGLSVKNLHPDEGPVEWSLKIRHGAEPSLSNTWAAYLMTDSDPVSLLNSQTINGYVIGVNLTNSDDTLRLWKIRNGVFIPVITSSLNWQAGIGTSGSARIDVERKPEGRWNLKVTGQNGNIICSSSGDDPELFTTGWFVISYKYTSSRDRLLWFDDISIAGIFREDKTPPQIIKCEASGKNSITVIYNEELSETALLPGNFSIRGVVNSVLNVTKLSSLSAKIQFEKEFVNNTHYTLMINTLCDRSNNCTRNVQVDFSFSGTSIGDVIISEIMADPLPVVSLPGREYLEIFNRTQSPVNINHWILATENQNYIFPAGILAPEEYMIVCQAQDTLLFKDLGKTAGLKSFPALTDGGRLLIIKDSSGNMIHGVDYSSKWYGDILKAEGGWSLEIIDEEFPFSTVDNWRASVAREGGTPGKGNSVSADNDDNFFSGIANVFPGDSLNVKLNFSETVIDMNDKKESLMVDNKGIVDIQPTDPLLREYSIRLEEPLQNRRIYSLTAGKNITDFAGNGMQTSSFDFGIPETVKEGEVLFNELLFNPLPGDPDYVEFYNCSDKIIDASRLLLVSVSEETGDTSGIYYLSTDNRCLLPGNYFLVTTDRDLVSAKYHSSASERIFEIPNLPSMPDDRGHLILFNRELDLIDEVSYDEYMHYSLLSGVEGISLERIRPTGLSTDKSLWHSASEASGWGTPGFMNSVFSEDPVTSDQVVFSSTRITPDNDGNEDFLIIDLKLSGNGNVVSVTVFDESGGFVKKLTDNMLAGNEASIIWNGTADDEKLVNSGIYILLISVFDDTGKTHKWKKVCTVIKR